MRKASACLIHLFVAAYLLQGSGIADRDSITNFLRNHRGGILVYSSRDDGCPYFIDLELDSLASQRICNRAVAHSPMVSPDGRCVVFECGGRMYASRLERNAEVSDWGPGYEPHWWAAPGTDSLYLVYSTSYGLYRWPSSPGLTIRKAVDLQTLRTVPGDSLVLLDKSMKGGLSRSGRYLGTGYSTAVVHDLKTAESSTLNSGNQTCNVSFMPSSDPDLESRLMFLVCPHSTFQIRTKADQTVWTIGVPPGMLEWQHPEWSSDSDYCTAIATSDAAKIHDYDIYIARVSDTSAFRILDGNGQFPHLWLPGDTAPPVSTPSIRPFRAGFVDSLTVSIGTAPAGTEIRYSLDGSDPGSGGTSRLYLAPFVIHQPTCVRARAFSGGASSRIASANYTKGILRDPENPQAVVPGVYYDCYTLQEALAKFPDVSGLIPGSSGNVESFLLPQGCGGDRFAVVFSGYLRVAYDGVYDLYTESDDGSRLFIGDSCVVNNDGIHSQLASSGEIGLRAGMHRIRVEYFDDAGVEVLQVGYSGPGLERQVIPDSVLFSIPLKGIEVIAPNGGEVLKPGDSLVVRWTAEQSLDLSCVVEITFDGGKNWVVLTHNAIVRSDPEWGAFRWLVPSLVGDLSTASALCRVRVRDYDLPELFDDCDTNFTILAPTVAVGEPRGGAGTLRWSRIGDKLVFSGTAGPGSVVTVYDISGRMIHLRRTLNGLLAPVRLRRGGVYLIRLHMPSGEVFSGTAAL